MLLLKLSDTQGGMFDEASEADMSLHFAKVGDELFDAAALPQRLVAVRPPDPNYPPVYIGVAPSRRVGQASEDRRSSQEWRTCRRRRIQYGGKGQSEEVEVFVEDSVGKSPASCCRETFHHLCNTRE